MFKTLIKDSRDILLGILQEYFKTNAEMISYNLKWDADPALSKILIADHNPDYVRYLPAIVVKGGSGREMKTGFKHFAEYVDPSGITKRRYAGKWQVPFYFVVGGLDGIVRDRIVDGIITCLTIEKYDMLGQNGLEMIPNTLSVGGDEEIPMDATTPLFRQVVSAQFLLEWYHDYTMPEETADKLVLDQTIVPGS